MSTWTVVLIVIIIALLFLVLLLVAAAAGLLFGRKAVQVRLAKYLKPNPDDIERDLVRLRKRYPNLQVNEVAEKYVREQAMLLGAVGFMTEMFGFAFPVVGFAIDAGFTTIRQMRMVHVIAALYGENELLDPGDMEIRYMALVSVGTLLPRFILKFLAGEIPVIGGIANFGINWFVTTSIGRTAIGWNTGKTARQIVTGELKRLKSTAVTAKESAAGAVKPWLRRESTAQFVSDGSQSIPKSIEAGAPPSVMTDLEYVNVPKVAATSDGRIVSRIPISSSSPEGDSAPDRKSSKPILRCDGVYISKQPVDFGMREQDQPYSYLRFYDDGTVIQSDIPGVPPAATVDSFDRANCRNRGHYQTDRYALKCVFPVSAESSGSGKASTIEEEGEIVGDELHVRHTSYINNFSYDEQYRFSPWPKG